ncbi:MAG: DUF1934 domain-containing protein [Ruminococcus sp.]
MKQQIQLKLRSVLFADGERTETELLTDGTMEQADGKVILSYEDSDATGFEGATTTITAENDSFVSITRTGTANSNLVIETGKKHHCLYGTPYGDITVGVFTHKIENDLSENGGSLYLKYTIDVNSAYMSDNEIYIDCTADKSRERGM